MCNPAAAVGGFQAAGSLLGSAGSAAQARQRNRAAKQNYEHALKVRKHEWYQQLSIWGAQRNKYYIDLNENDLAAQRGYSQAQVALNDEFAKAAQRHEGALMKYLQSHGKLAAAGRTGRSISRIGTLDLGALERASGRNYYQLTRSREAYKANVENIRNAQLSNRNKIQARVAFAPVPDLAPPPPVYEKEGIGVMGIVGAAATGLMGYASAGGKFPSFGKGKTNPGDIADKFGKLTGGDYSSNWLTDTAGWNPIGAQFRGQNMNLPYGMSQGFNPYINFATPQQGFLGSFLGRNPLSGLVGQDLGSVSTWWNFLRPGNRNRQYNPYEVNLGIYK